MSIRAMSAAVVTLAGLAFATCGPAVAATAAAGSVQLTGTQLAAALLPGSNFPAGYKLNKSNAYNSGKHLEKSAAKYHLSTMSCNTFANQFGQGGFGETAVASNEFTTASSDTSLSFKSYGQQAYQFKTSSAASSFYQGLRALFGRCQGTALTGTGTSAQITTFRVFSASSIGGHRTFQVSSSGSIATIKIAESLAITQAGNDVFTTGAAGITLAEPTSLSIRTIMGKLINRVSAFR